MRPVIHPPAQYTDDSTAWNDPGSLAPVDSPIMIRLPPGTEIHHWGSAKAFIVLKEEVVQAKRTAYISDKSRAMKYELHDGSIVNGRFRWTHA
jgi:hypothetical protein